MLDISVSYNRYKFIGHEFLTWLWCITETEPEYFNTIIPEMTTMQMGNRIVLENSINKASETITIKGDDADLKEGILALAKGAMVTELQLCYTSESQEWLFTIKGESLSLFNLKLPKSGPIESNEDLDGMVLEKAYLMEKLIQSLDKLYTHFISLRVSPDWQTAGVSKIKTWIKQRSH